MLHSDAQTHALSTYPELCLLPHHLHHQLNHQALTFLAHCSSLAFKVDCIQVYCKCLSDLKITHLCDRS